MIKGATLTKGGSRLPLVLGGILGLVAAALVVVYLSSAKDEGGSTQRSSGGGVPTVVAASDIAANTRLSESMLTVKDIPQSDVLSGAFGSIEGLTGQVTRVALVSGEQVIASKVIGSATISEFGENAPLSLLVEPGQRGVSVAVSSQVGAGGNVRPGDFIDVILIVKVKPDTTESEEATASSDQIAATVIQNVKVLAIDQERANPNPSSSTDPEEAKEENELATTVTLSVTPTQGEVLTMSEECGRVHDGRLAVSLRGTGDTNRLSNRTEWPADGPPPICSAVLGISALGD